MKKDQKCPNYDICYKMKSQGLKVCTSCFWRFKNEVLEFREDMECPMCSDVKRCVKFRKCEHYVCASLCFPRLHKCPMCPKLKENDDTLSNE